MAFIGKNIIENLTTAMYENLLIVYREYIQNSADSIDSAIKQGLISRDKAEIYIEIDDNKRYISIEDNGIGIKATDFQKIMSSIADSQKDATENKGFRGIGRLGGISACCTLRFSCSAIDEDIESIVTWDAKKVKEILIDPNQNPEASSLVDNVTTYETKACDKEKHFFKVEMIDIEKSASDLLEKDKVKRYLRSVAPLPYENPFIIFAQKIHDFAKENGFIIDEYNVFVNGEILCKNYKRKLYEEKNKQKECYDEITDVEFEIFKNSKGEILAWMWYGISGFEKQIPVCNEMRSIRLRKNNIQIGDARTLQKFYKEERGYAYFIGEVFAIHPELRPNARRDYFNINDRCKEFESCLPDLFYNRFSSVYRHANEYKKALQKKQELSIKEQEYQQKEENGFNSPEEQKSLQDEINELKIEASQAEKTINRKETKESQDKVLSKVYDNIKRKREYDIPKQEQSTTLKIDTSNVSEKDKNFSKNKVKFKAESLTQYNPKEQELISKIYGIIGKILPHDEADFIINKIQESLANESRNTIN